MSLNYFNGVLQKILASPPLEAYQKYQLLLEYWTELLTPRELENTRLLYVSNQVLFVATSNSSWAQNLSFKRYLLLQKLNDKLTEKLVNLRFSPAQWHHAKGQNYDVAVGGLENHPSFIEVSVELEAEIFPEKKNPQEALARWLEVIKKRSSALPPCPRCQVLSPPGELERWGVCALCAAKEWSHKPETLKNKG